MKKNSREERMERMNEIIGAIYPIPQTLADRLFDGKTKVFVKYVAHNTTKLAPGHKVVFYASHGLGKLIGEGIIEKVEFLNPEAVLVKCREDLFLNEEEFQAYVRRSPSRTFSKEMMTLVLKKLKRYAIPMAYNRPITMAGQYLTREEYRSFFQKEF